MKIHNTLTLLPDELGASWMYRIAKANGFNSLESMMKILHKEPKELTRNYFRSYHERSCIRHPELICDDLGISVFEFLLKTTIYPLIFPFLRKEQQDRYILTLFRDTNPILLGYRTKLIPELHYCPMCQREDMEKYNFTYLRRTHQIPGIYNCPVHHISLKNVRTDEDARVKGISESAKNNYTNFCKELMDDWLPCDISDIGNAIVKRMKDLSLSVKHLQKQMVDEGYELFLQPNMKTILAKLRNGQSSKHISTIIAICTFLFKNVKTLKKYLNFVSIEEDFRKNIKDSQTKLVSSYNDIFVELLHMPCGFTYYTTPHAVLCGWDCPHCDREKSDKEVFVHLVSKIEGGSYASVDIDSSIGKKENIIHRSCGRIYSVNPSGFLYGLYRCRCSILTKKMVNELLETKKEFKFLSLDEQHRTVSLFRPQCKHEFTIKFSVFKSNPVCPKCPKGNSRATRFYAGFSAATEYFKKCVADLVGNEYEVCSEYLNKKTTVLLRHATCGNIVPMLPETFSRGVRCKKCTPPMSRDEFIETVAKESNNRYVVIGMVDSTKAILQDTWTNEIIPLQKALVLQELRRPTPSKILPLDGKRELREKKPTIVDIVAQYIKDNYDFNEEIILKNVVIPNILYDQKERAFSTLLKRGFLLKVERGIYRRAK